MQDLANAIGVGVLTLQDIIKELRNQEETQEKSCQSQYLKQDMDINQLKPGMVLTGTVRNVSDFGAFVDIGVHQDGLVHKSQMSDKFVRHPLDIVKVGDIVEVRVLQVDEKRKRISLSMKKE